MSKLLTFKMTKNEAEMYGLLVCKCGHRENNHFDTGGGNTSCAWAGCECKKYRMEAAVGKLVKRKKK